jgi:hypothetical protein
MNIKLFLAKRFPKIVMPWSRLVKLTNSQKYKEARTLIEKFEKDNPSLKDFLEKDEAWKSMRMTCWKGIFLVEYYGEATKLLTDKKFEEAKKLSIEGGLVLRTFASSFGISEKNILELEKEIEKRFNLNQVKVGELDEFGKGYIANIKSDDEKFFMDLYINLSMIIPAACNAHMK